MPEAPARLGGDGRTAKEQVNFFKSQILFWLSGAIDGQDKNLSIFLKPKGRDSLTPFYNVLFAQPAFDQRQIPNNKYKLAMSVGKNRHRRVLEIASRHFVQPGKVADLGPTLMQKPVTNILEQAGEAPNKALSLMSEGFAHEIHENVVASMAVRLLETAFAEL